jgi:hypothetical protein
VPPAVVSNSVKSVCHHPVAGRRGVEHRLAPSSDVAPLGLVATRLEETQASERPLDRALADLGQAQDAV